MSDVTYKNHDEPFRIRDIAVFPERNLLRSREKDISLEPKIMQVLCVFTDNAREVVSREAMIKQVWEVDYGADESLTRAVSLLRKYFKSLGLTDKTIETIPKRGYRWLINPLALEDDHDLMLPRATLSSLSEPVSTETVEASRQIKQSETEKPKPFLSKPVLVLGLTALMGVTAFSILQSPGTISDPINNDISLTSTDPLGTVQSVGRGRSVAVLAFKDLSPGSDHEFFSDGVSDEIMHHLGSVPNLRVAGRSAAFAYRGLPVAPQVIGVQLDASHIIDGSVRYQNRQVRVLAQLIDSQTGTHIWSKTYDGHLDTALELQSQIAMDVMAELKLALSLDLEEVILLNIDDGDPSATMPVPPPTPVPNEAQ